MEYEKAGASFKLYSTMQMTGMLAHKVSNDNVEFHATPGGGRSQKKMLHPRTPNKTINCSISTTMGSGSSSSAKQLSCSAAMSTPPAKRFQRIRNPFEPILADRLHLPLIGSPSLFQRPNTPQLSSTQFEWNIDEVSSLKPTHVEPHETQFHDSPDPEYEAKAQSAISSYFKDQQIVPSPVDCPLRSHRIILSELNSNTPITKSGRRIRDCGTQTELTLPVVLPRALEEALMPYFQPHLAISEHRNCERDSQIRFSSDSNVSTFSETKDVSLRRKLFDMNNIVVLDEGRPSTIEAKSKMRHSNSSPPSTCDSSRGIQFAIVGKLSDSLDKSSFGSLSPISASDGLSNSPHSPTQNRSEMKSRIHTFLQDLVDAEQLSPIHAPIRQTSRRCRDKPQQAIPPMEHSSKDSYRNVLNQSETPTIGDISLACVNDDHNDSEKFTPDRSSSPLRSNYCAAEVEVAIGQQSIDSSFNMKISRLAVNSTKCIKQSQTRIVRPPDYDMIAHDDTQDLIDDDEMQVSQLSGQNFNCSSSSSTDTPRSKRRSASRKNLSQSFSLNWLEDEEEELEEEVKQKLQKSPIDVPRIDITVVDELIVKEHELQQKQQLKLEQQKQQPQFEIKITDTDVLEARANDDKHDDADGEVTRALFYRTDSGFNEMPTSGSSSTYSMGASQKCDGTLSPTKQLDVSMVCCSTPSKGTTATSATS